MLDGTSAHQLDFLAGGGEMGARMRALDWTATPLGPPAAWPQSLKTIVRVMLDSRYAMWMLWGPDLTFFCNDAYLPTVGIKRDWVLGARSDKVWEEIWPDIGPRIAQVLEFGHATWDEALLLFLERSGFPEETYHTFSYSPIYDDRSRIAGMLCVVTEVTERVIGERRLRILRDLAARRVGAESVEETSRSACEVLARYPFDVPFAALYLIEPSGNRASLAARTRELSAALLPEAIALNGTDSPWQLADVFGTEKATLVADLPGAGIEVRPEHWPDCIQQALVLPLKGSKPGVSGFLIAGISTRRALDDTYRSFFDLVADQVSSGIAEAQAYHAERRRAEVLTELDRAKTVFFSNVSHEFRTPLTLMLGPLEETIADDRVPQAARERLRLAERNAARMQKLVNSLLDFSRIEAGRIQASYQKTDLAALTRDLASTFRSAMEKAGLTFTVECEELADAVFVDREMWEKIVLNLLSNAFKFTLNGAVTVRLAGDGRHAVLEVADTGVGIPEHELPRLFERFHRVEGAHGRTQEGSGIGLALVHELVKLHGATIEATSALGEGTRLRVAVPFGSAHLPAGCIRAPAAPSSTATGARPFVHEALRWLQGPRMGAANLLPGRFEHPARPDPRFAATFGSRILLADDNADMRDYVRDLLSPNYSVETAADGEQALLAARRIRPDLILSDVMMPRMDGFGLLAALRADESLRHVPVVLLSARAGEEARIEGLDAGADDYVTKPFSSRELLARVGALLELRHMRRSADEAFRLRTEQFETLLTEAPLGVYLVDSDLRILEVNPTARRALGDISDLVGRALGDLVGQTWPREYADEVVQRFRRTLETGEPYYMPEHIDKRVDRGVTECYEWQINRIPLPDGRYGVVCYFRDISVHVMARTQLQMADRQKDEFLAMLAHELRNPLAPIRYAGELLSRLDVADSRARTAVDIVQRQVGNLARLVDDLLDVSRITLGRIELKRRAVQLADIVAQAVEVVEPLIRERRHRVSITSYGPLCVHGDSERLVQCVANVLANAAKYTDPEGEVRVESRQDGGQAVLTIADSGMGISPDLLPRVFDLFVQSDRSLDRAQGGLGIGLAIVKRLVEMHGGRVSASSGGLQMGSVFEIRLPLIDSKAERSASRAPSDAPPRRILVVDDNEDAATSLAMMLATQGHRVESAFTPEDALERVEAFGPDVALLDIGLPGMSGYELARRIRALPGLAGIRLVALTGYGQPEDKVRARSAGFDDHLVKPADIHALNRVLASGADGSWCTAQTWRG